MCVCVYLSVSVCVWGGGLILSLSSLSLSLFICCCFQPNIQETEKTFSTYPPTTPGTDSLWLSTGQHKQQQQHQVCKEREQTRRT